MSLLWCVSDPGLKKQVCSLVCIHPLVWSHRYRTDYLTNGPPGCSAMSPGATRQVRHVCADRRRVWLVHDDVIILRIFLVKLCIAHPEGRCAEDAEQRAFALVPIYPDVPASVPRTVRVEIIP